MERQYDADELIKDYEASSARKGRLPCPEVIRLRAMRDAGASFAEMEMSAMCHPSGAWLALDTIAVTYLFNTPNDTAEIQERYAYGVVMHDWGPTRPMLEHVLRRDAELIAPGALIVLFGWMRDNHPDLAGFLAAIKDRIATEASAWLGQEGLI